MYYMNITLTLVKAFQIRVSPNLNDVVADRG